MNINSSGRTVWLAERQPPSPLGLLKSVCVCVPMCVRLNAECVPLQLCALLTAHCFIFLLFFHVQPKNGFFIPVGLWDLRARLPHNA